LDVPAREAPAAEPPKAQEDGPDEPDRPDGGATYSELPASFWVGQLKDSNPDVRRQALEAIRYLGMAAVRPLLREAFAAEDAQTMVFYTSLLQTMCRGGDPWPPLPEIVDVLARCLDSSKPRVRAKAATTLGLFGKDAVRRLPDLRPSLREKDAAVREAARRAVKALQEEAAD
jgi:hypothetical protein